ncbi:hypothetical protein TNCV_123551 [Trichonephila clavipes]|nr:hypothetical protein TNCV_123551 [Trichonephila clavipes]
MFSSVVAVFGRPKRSSSPKLLQPRVNPIAQNFTVQNILEPIFEEEIPALYGKDIDSFIWTKFPVTHAYKTVCSRDRRGRGSPVVQVSDRGWLVTSSSPVPLKTCRVEERCTLNLSRAQTSSRWCGVVIRRGGASSGVALVT